MENHNLNRPQNIAILGLGGIAHAMADTLVKMSHDPRYSNAVKPYAVATRNSLERAQSFATQYGFAHAYGSYEDLLADPDVDVVYIATPHALHEQQAIACMKAGKAVLVEKSFTANADQARRVIDVSRQTGQVCVEAIWTRFMPSRQEIAKTVSSGVIGDVTEISASLSYPTSHKARIMDPAMAGGALLDVGVYDLNFVDMTLPHATVDKMESVCAKTDTGVDQRFAATLWLHNPDSSDANAQTVMATISSSILSVGDRLGLIRGTRGYIVVHNINNPESMDVYNAQHQRISSQALNSSQLTGYEYEVMATVTARVNGQTEAPEMPHSQTIRVMEQMDSLRRQWGEIYPFEELHAGQAR